jgi:hypothetical protein
MQLLEATLKELYDSTVEAFPKCGLRQNSTNTIVFTHLEWLPFVGMKTLRIKGDCYNKQNGHQYQPLIIFKNVQYYPEKRLGLVEIMDNTGKTYFLEKLGGDKNDVLVRCGCGDFFYRGNWFDHLEKCLAGPVRKKYEAKYAPGSANPTESMMFCKHLIKLGRILNASSLLVY